jgi:DNA-binding transcriptional ArsR family regulator
VQGLPDITMVGAAIGDPARAAMLLALLGGESMTAGELARLAGKSPSGASAHLRVLSAAGVVVVEARGRSRLFRLAGPEVAEALEALTRIAPSVGVKSLRQAEATKALKRARTCYDHLAGELGTALTDALVTRRLLRRNGDVFEVTEGGARWLAGLDIDVAALGRGRRSLARACLDWTERRPHLAGALGAEFAQVFFSRGWVRRLPGGRAIAVTSTGHAWLRREFELAV